MTEQEIITARIAEMTHQLRDLQAAIRQLEIRRASLALHSYRQTERAASH
ncbi:hypothetical protein HU675_0026430 [Bradyrhizobium septentrionale]|nr:hypothetical protein [Bradyrhizobium septentrionale]UGY21556.1 hypothetical protein HU675_0026430 [Bradyrhizobium septentrionale]